MNRPEGIYVWRQHTVIIQEAHLQFKIYMFYLYTFIHKKYTKSKNKNMYLFLCTYNCIYSFLLSFLCSNQAVYFKIHVGLAFFNVQWFVSHSKIIPHSCFFKVNNSSCNMKGEKYKMPIKINNTLKMNMKYFYDPTQSCLPLISACLWFGTFLYISIYRQWLLEYI